jgi:porphobilinogen synthase
MQSLYPTTRYRRLRSSSFLRDLMRETQISLNDLIYPIFVEEDIDAPVPVSSMPGVFRHPEKDLDKVMKEIHGLGLKAVMMFGVSHYKDETGSDSMRESGLMARMIERAKTASPDTLVMADACFCEYTSHGHCGVVTAEGVVHNDQTLENLAQQAITAAQAGADVIAPSGMMDGMVSAIRQGLDQEGFENTPIMAYSTKFASGFYGPFRVAAGCELKGDRKTYQMDPANGREALKESFADEAEGADILMVKPGMPYLDVIARLRDRTLLPIAAYQVSGEYAMIKFAAQAGALDETTTMMESLIAFKRAGADLVLSYFSPDVARILNS